MTTWIYCHIWRWVKKKIFQIINNRQMMIQVKFTFLYIKKRKLNHTLYKQTKHKICFITIFFLFDYQSEFFFVIIKTIKINVTQIQYPLFSGEFIVLVLFWKNSNMKWIKSNDECLWTMMMMMINGFFSEKEKIEINNHIIIHKYNDDGYIYYIETGFNQ